MSSSEPMKRTRELAVDDGRKALVVDRKVAEAHLLAVLEDNGVVGYGCRNVVIALLGRCQRDRVVANRLDGHFAHRDVDGAIVVAGEDALQSYPGRAG